MESIKIAYDAKRITHNSTGLGNYGRNLINILSAYYPENLYLLYTPNKGKDGLRRQLRNSCHIQYVYPDYPKKGLKAAWWRSWGITRQLKKDNVSLFHGLSAELPFGLKRNKIKSIVTIHDLIFIRFPQYYHLIDRLIYTYKYKKACQQANKVIAISECTKRDIIRYFHIPESKIEVVYQGCDKSFKERVDESTKSSVKDKYGLPPRYILYLGSIEERKNLLLVVKAMKLLGANIFLVAVGKKTEYMNKVHEYIDKNGLCSQVKFLSNVPFSDLPSIYQMADLFVYPSRFEGFGIPVIEAMNCGVPVIAAKGSCLEEAGGSHSIYVNPDDEVGMAEAVRLVLSDNKMRDQMIEEGKKYVTRFEDEVIAKRMMGIYSEVHKMP